jgi:hypothetical protein
VTAKALATGVEADAIMRAAIAGVTCIAPVGPTSATTALQESGVAE